MRLQASQQGRQYFPLAMQAVVKPGNIFAGEQPSLLPYSCKKSILIIYVQKFIMKTFNWLAPLIFLLTLNACKKEVTKDVKFTNTEYTNLGTYDSSGKPENLAPPDVVDPSLTTFL